MGRRPKIVHKQVVVAVVCGLLWLGSIVAGHGPRIRVAGSLHVRSVGVGLDRRKLRRLLLQSLHHGRLQVANLAARCKMGRCVGEKIEIARRRPRGKARVGRVCCDGRRLQHLGAVEGMGLGWTLGLQVEHLAVSLRLGGARSGRPPRGRFPGPRPVFVAALVEMDELLMSNKKIPDVHI